MDMVTYPYAYMTYIVSPLAGLGGGISWRPPAYSLLNRSSFVRAHILTTEHCPTVVPGQLSLSSFRGR